MQTILGSYNPDTNPYGNTVNSNQVADTNIGENYDDATSWNEYLKVLDASNQYNSAEAQKVRDWNEYMRDTQVQSYMKQLRDAGINPILAVQSGFAGASYPTSAQAQSYSGNAPYSNSARVESAIIRTVGSVLSSLIKVLPVA